jgi:hypothetical protein
VKDKFLKLDIKVRFVVLAKAVSNLNKLNILILFEVSITSNRKD